MILTSIHRFFQADDAVTAAEYAVILALILLALISAVTAVGNSTSGLWQSDSNKISAACSGS
jgi:pilus assembly protein Flp/PilA